MDQWANMTAIGAASGYSGCSQEGLGVSATTNNQLSATGITYDASGNMLTDGLNTYGWNAESEIKTASGVNYPMTATATAFRNRAAKSTGTARARKSSMNPMPAVTSRTSTYSSAASASPCAT